MSSTEHVPMGGSAPEGAARRAPSAERPPPAGYEAPALTARETEGEAPLPSAALLDAVPDAVVVADGDGVIVRVNTQAERLFGYTRAELEGHDLEVLLPERFRERHVAHRGRYVEGPHVRPMASGLALYAVRKGGRSSPRRSA